jgi:hypothetical protein
LQCGQSPSTWKPFWYWYAFKQHLPIFSLVIFRWRLRFTCNIDFNFVFTIGSYNLYVCALVELLYWICHCSVIYVSIFCLMSMRSLGGFVTICCVVAVFVCWSIISFPGMPIWEGTHTICILMCLCIATKCFMLLAICEAFIVSFSASRLILLMDSMLSVKIVILWLYCLICVGGCVF